MKKLPPIPLCPHMQVEKPIVVTEANLQQIAAMPPDTVLHAYKIVRYNGAAPVYNMTIYKVGGTYHVPNANTDPWQTCAAVRHDRGRRRAADCGVHAAGHRVHPALAGHVSPEPPHGGGCAADPVEQGVSVSAGAAQHQAQARLAAATPAQCSGGQAARSQGGEALMNTYKVKPMEGRPEIVRADYFKIDNGVLTFRCWPPPNGYPVFVKCYAAGTWRSVEAA